MVIGFVILVFVAVVLMAVEVVQQLEITRLRNEVNSLHMNAARMYKTGLNDGIETASDALNHTVTETVGSITKLMMGEVVGEREVGVQQPTSDQTPTPEWFEWEDAEQPVNDFGVGDSVFVPRDFDDRVASIGDGESIIPGVPLPDMSGENA